jgi:hypothetical protein
MALVPIVCRCKSKRLSPRDQILIYEYRDGKTQWRSHSSSCGAQDTNLVYGLSSRPSLPCHNILVGAASSAAQIVTNPGSATTLLAENLPKASNFYISYFILQGLGIAAGDLLNIGALVMLSVVGKFLDKSPRKMFKRFITLSGLGWGSMYPKFGNLGIIGISSVLVLSAS